MNRMNLTRSELAGMIDHAALKPEATLADLEADCRLCAEQGVFSICVRPSDVRLAVEMLGRSSVRVGTVVGFPHGSVHTKIKAAETARAMDDGGEEIDMVLNIGRLRSGQIDYVCDDIAAVVAAAKGKCVKVIFECCYLNRDQKISACKAAIQAGAQFVKTSTGLASGRATIEDVVLMRGQVGKDFGVKAAGGIRTLADAETMIAAGANRLGVSRTAEILRARR